MDYQRGSCSIYPFLDFTEVERLLRSQFILFITMTTTLSFIQMLTNYIRYYGTIFVLVTGIPGCFSSFITFTSPQLRNNSCAFYFLVGTVFEFISITFGAISSSAGPLFGSNLLNTNRVYCKARAYLVYAIPLIATYMVLLASIDRCLSSAISVHLRSFSQMKIAYRAIIVAILLSLGSCSHILASFDLRPQCMTMPGAYAVFDSMFVVFWVGMIPHVLMLIFGSLTLLNIRRTKRRIHAHGIPNPILITQQQRREQKTDRHLMIVSHR